LTLNHLGAIEWNSYLSATAKANGTPKNLFTGWRDVKLSEQGLAEAAAAGQEAERKRLSFRYRLHFRAHPRHQNLQHRAGRERSIVGCRKSKAGV
jgi:broad specificity phosphatase PhoE